MTPLVLICVTMALSDGDSGRCVTADGETHRVRIAGIDAGEVRPFTRCRQQPDIWACSSVARETGPTATARARQLAINGAACTVMSTDRYRRVVATCTVNGRDLGGILVSEGLAINDTDYRPSYASEEQEARREGRGVWR
jgi:endonuclease YncB( thermonuclease family)